MTTHRYRALEVDGVWEVVDETGAPVDPREEDIRAAGEIPELGVSGVTGALRLAWVLNLGFVPYVLPAMWEVTPRLALPDWRDQNGRLVRWAVPDYWAERICRRAQEIVANLPPDTTIPASKARSWALEILKPRWKLLGHTEYKTWSGKHEAYAELSGDVPLPVDLPRRVEAWETGGYPGDVLLNPAVGYPAQVSIRAGLSGDEVSGPVASQEDVAALIQRFAQHATEQESRRVALDIETGMTLAEIVERGKRAFPHLGQDAAGSWPVPVRWRIPGGEGRADEHVFTVLAISPPRTLGGPYRTFWTFVSNQAKSMTAHVGPQDRVVASLDGLSSGGPIRIQRREHVRPRGDAAPDLTLYGRDSLWIRKDILRREDGSDKNMTLGVRVVADQGHPMHYATSYTVPTLKVLSRDPSSYDVKIPRGLTGKVVEAGTANPHAAKQAVGTTQAYRVEVDNVLVWRVVPPAGHAGE